MLWQVAMKASASSCQVFLSKSAARSQQVSSVRSGYMPIAFLPVRCSRTTSSVSGYSVRVCRSTFLRSSGLLASIASQSFCPAGRYAQLPSFMRHLSA